EGAMVRRFSAALAPIAALVCLAGCAAEQGRAAYYAPRSQAQEYAGAMKAGGSAASAPAAVPSNAAPPENAAATVPAPLPRKIIYNTEIDLVPESLTTAEKEMRRLVRAAGGYVADTEVGGQPGTARQGEWTVRIPVERYETFVSDLA